MKKTRLIVSLTLAVLLMTAPFIFANNNDPLKNVSENPTMTSEKGTDATIVGVAASNDDFSTLVAAVKAADLVAVLNSEGPFTVFAPTNEAFGKLPEGTVEDLLKAENRATLTSILTYHVIAGEFMAADVVQAIQAGGGTFEVSTVNGEKISAHIKDGKVMLQDAKGNMSEIILTDVDASNGVIHAIDTVVMP